MPGKLPFPRFLANTPIQIILTDGLTENGKPKETVIFDGKAIYDEKSKQVMDANRSLIHLSAKAIIEGDVSPGEDIEGFVVVEGGGRKRSIFRATRPRNPDGSVYSTELELM